MVGSSSTGVYPAFPRNQALSPLRTRSGTAPIDWRGHRTVNPMTRRARACVPVTHQPLRTGDGEFRADSGQLVAFISVAKFGGSDSLPIRPTGNAGSSNSIRSAN